MKQNDIYIEGSLGKRVVIIQIHHETETVTINYIDTKKPFYTLKQSEFLKKFRLLEGTNE